MKAKFVNEYIGKNPLDSMGIGMVELRKLRKIAMGLPHNERGDQFSPLIDYDDLDDDEKKWVNNKVIEIYESPFFTVKIVNGKPTSHDPMGTVFHKDYNSARDFVTKNSRDSLLSKINFAIYPNEDFKNYNE